jgi:beta-phosphoglucomutase
LGSCGAKSPGGSAAGLSPVQAVIFDLDGVIVSTDECHYQAWKGMAARHGLPFDRRINEGLRGVSRMESLEKILKGADRPYAPREREALAEEKNRAYRALIMGLTPADILPGAMETLHCLRGKGILLAIGSSSRNAPAILERIGLKDFFDAVADGNRIQRSKPDPEVFLLAAGLLGIFPKNCLVVEDAWAGVEAALAGGMQVLGVGGAAAHPGATLAAASLQDIDLWAAIP